MRRRLGVHVPLLLMVLVGAGAVSAPADQPGHAPIRRFAEDRDHTMSVNVRIPVEEQRVSADGPAHTWRNQFGTRGDDVANAVAVDRRGNVVVVGATQGNLAEKNLGGTDAFVRVYTPDGSVKWTAQIGTPGDDVATSVAVDKQRSIYVAGYRPGESDDDHRHEFIAKFNKKGKHRWTRHYWWQTKAGEHLDTLVHGLAVQPRINASVCGGFGCVISAGSIQLRGSNPWATVAATDTVRGSLVWTDSFRISTNSSGRPAAAFGVAANASDIVVSGETVYDAHDGDTQAFVRGYSPTGTVLWTSIRGERRRNDAGSAVALDPLGAALLSTVERGKRRGNDVVVTRYETSGAQLWDYHLGSKLDDSGWAVAIDHQGNVIAVGTTAGDLLGNEPMGVRDLFIVALNPDGELAWSTLEGTVSEDDGLGVAVTPRNEIVVVGGTYGALPNARSKGGRDAFVMKIGQPAGRNR